MKRTLFMASGFALCVNSIGAHASCQTLIQDIASKIESNGVSTSQFTLQAVPNAQSNNIDGEIVGSCEDGSHKIIYRRGQHDVKTLAAQDTSANKTLRPQQHAIPGQDQKTHRAEPNNQTTPEESSPDKRPDSRRQTTPEESRPNNPMPSEDSRLTDQTTSGALPSVEDRYKFLLEGTHSDT